MIAEIVRRTLEAGKPAATKDTNVIDTPEGMTRLLDPHPDVDVAQKAPPHHHHHPYWPPQSPNDLKIENAPKSQSIEEILLLATTVVRSTNTLADPKKNGLIRVGTEVLVMIARMNMPEGNRLVPKRKNANGKNEKRLAFSKSAKH